MSDGAQLTRRWITAREGRRALVGWATLAVPLVITTAIAAAVGSNTLTRTVIDFLIVSVLVVGQQVFIGNSGIVSFGHIGFVGIGAYVAALATIPPEIKEVAFKRLPELFMSWDEGLLVALILAAVVCIAIALLVGGAFSRMHEMAMPMATLAFLVVVHDVLLNWEALTNGAMGVYGIPSLATLWVCLGTLLVVLVFARVYRESRVGLRLQATRDDSVAARSLGISLPLARLGSWTLSAALMGLGGALYAMHVLAFTPAQFFFALTFSTLSMMVLGGRYSVTGAVVGAAVISALSEGLRRLERGPKLGALDLPELLGLTEMVLGVAIILILIYRSEGIVSRWELDDYLARWRPLAKFLGRAEEGADPRQTAGDSPTGSSQSTSSDDGPSVTVSGDSEEQSNRTGIGAAVCAPPAMQADEVTKTFAGLRALDSVSLSLSCGEILGLIGPNGSGKTTLLNVVSGFLRPDGGKVVLQGRDISGLPAHHVARLGVARTFQNVRLFSWLTVHENLEAAAGRGSSEHDVDQILHLMDLADVSNRVASTIPYGLQRRVEIARALVRRPTILLVDEPAAGMNESESDELMRMIFRARDLVGCGVLVIDHDLHLIMHLCSRVHVLDGGKTIAEGTPEAVASDAAVVEAYMGSTSAESGA